MDKKPLVSVLMGIYNCADTLEEAVDCIINQTYENWELIMCDDCSSDNTLEVARKIAEKDNLRSLFIKFVEGDMCRKFLTRGAMDLQYLDVHMEQKFKDNKNYFLLYNLNHRMIMACID